MISPENLSLQAQCTTCMWSSGNIISKLLLQYNYYINYLPEGTISMGHTFLQLLTWGDFPDYPVTVVNR